MDYTTTYQSCIKDLQNNPHILAVLLTGSRAKGMENTASDTDIYIIFKSGTSVDFNKYKQELFGKYPELHLDLSNKAFQTLESFKDFAVIGSMYGWDRYNIARAHVEFDKTDGGFTKLVEAKRILQPEEIKTVLDMHFGDYLTFTYRTLKGTLDGNDGALLDASELTGHLLWVYFALHGRVRPFNKYLSWELTTFPLVNDQTNSSDLFDTVQKIRIGSVQDVKDMYQKIERVARSLGYGYYIDAWGTKLETVL